MLRLFVIFVFLFLSACNDEEVKGEKVPSVKVDKEATAALEAPKKVIEAVVIKEIEPELPMEQDLFDEFQESELSAKAALLRSERKLAYETLFKGSKDSAASPKYQLMDKDYGDLPKDLSTLPVDRSRTLTTDMRINAVLDDDISSQIPGVVIAIVDRSVFSPNNKNVLLPVFTKIVCEYEGVELQGQTRLPMKCTRAIRPDGVSISLSDAIVADQMGRTGLTGEVDNRTFETYAGAFVMSGISALAQSGVNQNTPNYPNWRTNSQTIFSNNIGQVTAEVIKKNIDLRPIIYIKAGTRMQIRPRVDIVLKEPILIDEKLEGKSEKSHI